VISFFFRRKDSTLLFGALFLHAFGKMQKGEIYDYFITVICCCTDIFYFS